MMTVSPESTFYRVRIAGLVDRVMSPLFTWKVAENRARHGHTSPMEVSPVTGAEVNAVELRRWLGLTEGAV
jgi:hypothetical protein